MKIRIQNDTGKLILIILSLFVVLAIGFIIGLGRVDLLLYGIGILFISGSGMIIPLWVITAVYPLIHIFGQVPISVEGITFSFERVLVLFAGAGLIFQILVRRRNFPIPKFSLIIGWIVWFASFVISWLLVPSENGLAQLLSYFQKIIFAWLVFIAFVLVKDQNVQRAVRLYILVAIFASFVTVYVYITEGSASVVRMGSFTFGENLIDNLRYGLARVGAGETMAAWLALLEVSMSKKVKERIFWVIIVVWLLLVSTLALRREYLVTIPLCLLLAALYKPTGLKSRGLAIGLIVILVISLVIFQLPEWRSRIMIETIDTFQQGKDPRLQLAVASYQAWERSPWLGFGPGNFVKALYTKTNASLPASVLAGEDFSSHNSFATAAVEGGILAIFGLAWAIVKLLTNIIKAPRKGLTNNYLEKILGFGPIIWLQLFFWLIFGDAVLLNVFWFWIGFLIAMIYRSEHSLQL